MAVYIFHGKRMKNYTCKVFRNLGGSGGAYQEKFFDFEHPEITSGTFLDKKLSSYQFLA